MHKNKMSKPERVSEKSSLLCRRNTVPINSHRLAFKEAPLILQEILFLFNFLLRSYYLGHSVPYSGKQNTRRPKVVVKQAGNSRSHIIVR